MTIQEVMWTDKKMALFSSSIEIQLRGGIYY